MNRNEIKEFAIDYIRFLIEAQMGVDGLYANLCYGGVIYEDTRIDLDAVFDKEELVSQDLNSVADECSSNIGSMREYLVDRSEDELVRDDEEPIAYIQLPEDIWNALYGEADGEVADYLIEVFEDFMDDHEMTYDLTEYGRNAILVYPKRRYYKVAELSDSEQQLIKETLANDHRYIGNKSNGENGQLFNEFNEKDGMFFQFKRMVEAYPGELVVAFRGNSNKITVYYYNNVVWDLTITGKDCYTASFNYDHARYYCGKEGKNTGEDCLEPLRNLLYVDENKREKWFYRKKEEEFTKTDKGPAIGILKWKRDKGHPFEYDLIEKSYFIIKSIWDSYFNIMCSKDRFREKAEIAPPKRAKESHIEKRWQQELFNYFKKTEGEGETNLFAYDLEFSQPFPNRKIRKKIGVNEPDILAVRFKNGVPKHLVFVEVKSTKIACEDKSSGVKGHIIGMKRYTDEECFLRKRVDDVWRILEQYQLTGLYSQLEGINFGELKKSIRLEENVERVLLFTNNELPPGEMTEDERNKGSALDYYDAHKKMIWGLAKAHNCKIWVTKSNYFDDTIRINPVSLDGCMN